MEVKCQSKVHYTTHHCWSWILKEAVETISSDCVKCSRWRELPSVVNGEYSKGLTAYALFRVEFGCRGVWCTSKVFEFLDAKDALYARLQQAMPDTLLLKWDCFESSFDIEEEIKGFILRNTGQVILKAALGSGGHGIYFVGCDPRDTLSVIRGHACKALATEGFMDKLSSQYQGEIPRWSLQALLNPVLVGSPGRRSQVRVYVVFLESVRRCYYYHTVEVRLPQWESSNELVELDAEYEQQVCQGGNAVPYNKGRVKSDTERYLLHEIPEVQRAAGVIHDSVRSAFVSLQDALQSRCHDRGSDNIPAGRELVAVIGADLLVVRNEDREEGFCSYILEANNNPAMANPSKHKMSTLYRQHCIDFCHDLLRLGLTEGREVGRFVSIF